MVHEQGSALGRFRAAPRRSLAASAAKRFRAAPRRSPLAPSAAKMLSAYEEERRANMKRNHEQLVALGLADGEFLAPRAPAPQRKRPRHSAVQIVDGDAQPNDLPRTHGALES